MTIHLTTLTALLSSAETALEEIKTAHKLCPADYAEYCCVWSSLKVVDVLHYQSVHGDTGFQILIEEANCPKLSADIRERLKVIGLVVEVRTEW